MLMERSVTSGYFAWSRSRIPLASMTLPDPARIESAAVLFKIGDPIFGIRTGPRTAEPPPARYPRDRNFASASDVSALFAACVGTSVWETTLFIRSTSADARNRSRA